MSRTVASERGRSRSVACSRAPLRLSFCGGGSDLMPYAAEHGGVVLSTTIARYAFAALKPLAEQVMRVHSLDYDLVRDYSVDEPLLFDGKLDLIKACLRRFRGMDEKNHHGFDLFLETHAPPGSGLGASSALVVAIISAFDSWLRLDLSRYEVADLAYRVERKDVGITGGLQDQYAAAFGGFNLIEFRGDSDVVVNPLRIDQDIVNDIEHNSMLVFTGATRHSDRIIESQVRGYESGDRRVLQALERKKQLALAAKTELLRGDLGNFAQILHEDWIEKKATSSSITTPAIDDLYEQARRFGALGGKVSGAGGGGFMFLICPFERKAAVAERLTELQAEVSPVSLETLGVTSWLTTPFSQSTTANNVVAPITRMTTS